MLRPSLKFVTLLALCCAGTWALVAQIESNAPIKDFRLPVFGADGRLVWEISGIEGVYTSAEQIDIKGATLDAYSQSGESRSTLRIECQSASVLHKEGRAQGQGSVFARGESFAITGENWRWDTASQTLVIEEDVRVLFDLSLTSILK